MVYICSPRFLVANIAGNMCYDEKGYKTELTRLKTLGVKGFIQWHKKSLEATCDYFTILCQCIEPITNIEVRA